MMDTPSIQVAERGGGECICLWAKAVFRKSCSNGHMCSSSSTLLLLAPTPLRVCPLQLRKRWRKPWAQARGIGCARAVEGRERKMPREERRRNRREATALCC